MSASTQIISLGAVRNLVYITLRYLPATIFFVYAADVILNGTKSSFYFAFSYVIGIFINDFLLKLIFKNVMPESYGIVFN
jgi:hypothetical protein